MTEVKRPLSLHLASTGAPDTEPQTFSAIKRAALGSAPRPASRGLTKSSSVTSTKTICSTISSSSSSSTSYSSSTTSTSCTNGYNSPDSPSLILPYLYVGDQAQTQIDTISNLNIKYILSLQSLPKFLDTPKSSSADSTDNKNKSLVTVRDAGQPPQASTSASEIPNPILNIGTPAPLDLSGETRQIKRPSAIIRRVDGDEVEIQTQINDGDAHSPSPVMQSGQQKQTCAEQFNVGVVAEPSVSKTAEDVDDTIARELLPSANSSKDYLVKFKSCVNKLIKGKCINISDTFETLVDKFFDETHNFIEEARRNKCNILVHCKAGISRSPTIAIAYLMKWKRLHLQEAYEFVKQCRPQISPNLNFMGQLINYERQLLQRGAHRQTSCSGSSILPSPLSFCLPGPHSTSSDDMDEVTKPYRM